MEKANKKIELTEMEVKKFNTKYNDLRKVFDNISTYTQEFTLESGANMLKTQSKDISLLTEYKNKVNKEIELVKSSREKVYLFLLRKEINKTISFINQTCTEFKLKLERVNSLDIELKKSYLKLKGYNGWDCTILKYGQGLYELCGFTDNSRIFLFFKTQQSIMRVKIVANKFGSVEKSKHYEKLTNDNEKTLRDAVKRFLGGVNSIRDLDNIILVQEYFERLAREEKLAKKYAKIKKMLSE